MDRSCTTTIRGTVQDAHQHLIDADACMYIGSEIGPNWLGHPIFVLAVCHVGLAPSVTMSGEISEANAWGSGIE